jgi:methyl-accepting chemotaxis protein
MNWFMKLSLAKKLLSAFFTLALIAAGMGLYSLSNIISVGNSLHRMYENNLVATSKAQIAFREYLVYSRTALRFLTQEGEERENNIQRAIEYRQASQAAFDDYRSTAVTQAENAIADKIQKGLNAYTEGVQDAVRMARQGRSLDGLELLNGSLRAVNHQIETDFGALVGEMLQQGAAADQDAREAVASMKIVMAVLIALATLFAISFGLFLTRIVVRQIGGEPDYARDVVSRIAEGDLTVKVNLRKGDEDSLLAAMSSMVQRLTDVIGQVTSSADSLASASEQVSASSGTLSQNATEQASSVEEISASIEETAATVTQNAENAGLTDSMATQSATSAKEGGNAVRETVDAMKSIADKISIIDECGHRGGPCRRPWQGLRRGGGRGAQAGRALPGGGTGNRRTGRLQREDVRARRHLAGRDAALDWPHRRSGQGNRRCVPGAAFGYRSDQWRHRRAVQDHPGQRLGL